MAEFEIDGKQYRSGKLSAMQQFHVARKLGPIIAKLGPSSLRKPDASMVDMIEPAVDALAAMPEEDCDFVLHRCLSVVQRQQGANSWARIWNENAKRMVFDDIDLAQMLQIAMQVLSDNLGNFMGAPASISSQSPSPGSAILETS